MSMAHQLNLGRCHFTKATWFTSKDQKNFDEFTKFKLANTGEDKDGHVVYSYKANGFKYRDNQQS